MAGGTGQTQCEGIGFPALGYQPRPFTTRLRPLKTEI